MQIMIKKKSVKYKCKNFKQVMYKVLKLQKLEICTLQFIWYSFLRLEKKRKMWRKLYKICGRMLTVALLLHDLIHSFE